MTKPELENKMAVLLGGRAAEQVIFNQVSTGASDDLVRATDIARAMVLRYGMSEALGYVAYEREHSAFLQQGYALPQSREYSDATANKIDETVRSLVDQAFGQATSILRKNQTLLEQAAIDLLKTEILTQPRIAALKQAIIRET